MVSEKTGYPVEMLDLDMGLDADLGIDSIKRVEILSALQEKLPGSPLIGPEHLGSLQTLGEIARHLGAGAATAAIPNENPADKTAPVDLAMATPADSSEAVGGSGSAVNRSTLVPVPLPAVAEALALADKGQIWITDDGSRFSAQLCSLVKASGRAASLVSVDDAYGCACRPGRPGHHRPDRRNR